MKTNQLHYSLSALVLAGLIWAGCGGARETAQPVQTQQEPAPTPGEWITLYDGTGTEGWKQAGPGHFEQQADGSIVSRGGMGLFYYDRIPFRDFVLEAEFLPETPTANSGIFIRFPERTDDPWYAVNNGYEIQIDDSQENPIAQTGSVYTFSAPFAQVTRPGEWNQYRIEARGQRIEIYLNGVKVNDFIGSRGREGFIGIQNHGDQDRVRFRNIRVMPLAEGGPENYADLFKSDVQGQPIRVLVMTATHGFRHTEAIDATKRILDEVEDQNEFEFDFTENMADLNTANLSNYDVLFFANSTLRTQTEVPETPEATGASGTAGQWNVRLNTGGNFMNGVVALDGEPGAYTGTITFSGAPPAPLEEITLENDELGFAFEAGQYGRANVKSNVAGDVFKGTLTIGGNGLDLSGTRAGGAAVPLSNAWDIQVDVPGTGIVPGRITVEGAEGAQTGRMKLEGQSTMNLEEVRLSAGELTFAFDSPQYGRVRAQGSVSGDQVSGSFAASEGSASFTGTRVGEQAAAEPEILTTDAQKQAILEFVRAGKGIAVAHAGLDAFYDWPEYKEMVGGGLFVEHPWTQHVTINVEEHNPATGHWGETFGIRDEIYVLDENPRWTSRVLLSLNNESVGIEQGPADITRNDYPISWVRHYDGGRVFVTKLGHFADVWSRPDYLRHLLQGMRMVAGRVQADLGGYRLKETISENVWPDDIAVDERGNVWIAELQGKVHRYDASTGRTAQIGLIETTNPVNIEHGLYGIEVDPDFYDGQPWVYLYYAEPETFINTLVRIRYANGRLDMDSREVILRVPTEPQCCHQAGDLEWGSDKTILISTGDTGMSEVRPTWENSEAEIEAFVRRNNLEDYHWSRLADSERSAQNLQDLRGKILRINRDGSIPKDNPFFGQPGVRWEIMAYGLRNPYRFKYDEASDKLYIGIVGPDEVVTYDWYDIGEGGENFGWPRVNGRLLYNEWKPEMIPNFSPSIWEYTYQTGGRSASFGPIYRSTGQFAFPSAFDSTYFVYDWARRWIKWAELEEDVWESDTTGSVKREPYQARIPHYRLKNIRTFDILTETAPISMEVGPDGSLYVAEFTGFWGPAPGARVTRYRWMDGPQPVTYRANGDGGESDTSSR